MIYLINIFTIILAVVFALQLSNEKNVYKVSVLVILAGIVFHFIEAYLNYTSNTCETILDESLISSIDKCINYESGLMIFAQAGIIAGFTVIFVKYLYSKK